MRPERENALEAVRGPVNIDARQFFQAAPRPVARFARCGNCGKKLLLTGDPERDHHTAMAHKVEECDRNVDAAIQYRELLAEMKERNEQPLQIAAKKPWWKIW